jgi:MFS family permease
MTETSSKEPGSPFDGLPSSRLIPASNRTSILFFCIVNFLWWIGLYLYVPILPVYIQEAGANLNMVGTVLSAYAIPQILLRIPIGIWSDRMGRRKPLVVGGIVFTSLGALGLGLSTTAWFLFLSRMTTGIGAAAWVVFPLYLTAYYPANDSGKAIGLINFIRSVGLIVATVGGGFIADGFGLSQPFFIAALLGVIALFALLFTKEMPVRRVQTEARHSFLSVATRPLLLVVSIMAILLLFTTFTGVFGFIPVYAAEIGASSSELGLITMINLGFSALGSLVSAWVCERWGYRSTIIGSALLIGGSLLAVPFIAAVPVLMIVQISYGIGSGVLMTLFMVLSIRGLPQEQQATAMGVFQAVYAIGMFAGPLTSGFLGSELGLSTVFYLAALFSLLMAILAFLPIFSRHKIS